MPPQAHQHAVEANDVAETSRLRQHLPRPRKHADREAIRPLPGLVQAGIRDDHRHFHVCGRAASLWTISCAGAPLAVAVLCGWSGGGGRGMGCGGSDETRRT